MKYPIILATGSKNSQSFFNRSEKSMIRCSPNLMVTFSCSHTTPQHTSTVWFPSSSISVIGLWVATTPLLMLSINTGNSPVQPPADIFSSPFNAGGAVLLDVFVRLDIGVAFENEMNVFDGVTFGALSAADFIWPTHPAARYPAMTRKRSRIIIRGFARALIGMTIRFISTSMEKFFIESDSFNTLVEPVLLKYI